MDTPKREIYRVRSFTAAEEETSDNFLFDDSFDASNPLDSTLFAGSELNNAMCTPIRNICSLTLSQIAPLNIDESIESSEVNKVSRSFLFMVLPFPAAFRFFAAGGGGGNSLLSSGSFLLFFLLDDISTSIHSVFLSTAFFFVPARVPDFDAILHSRCTTPGCLQYSGRR